MKRQIRIVIILFTIVTLCSCTNLFNKFTSDETEYVTIRLSTSGNERTIFPSSFVDASYTLTGTMKNTAETLLETYQTVNDLQSATIHIREGEWTFTLNAIINSNIAATTTLTQTITNETNTLTFSFSRNDFNYTAGYGSMKVSITFPNNAKVVVVTAGLYSVQTPTTVESSFSDESLSISEGTETDSVTYSKTSVPSGMYFIVYKFFQDSSRTKRIATYHELVKIANDFASNATRSLTTLNSLYDINYVMNDISFTSGFTAPATYCTSETVTLPVAENFDQTTLSFAGWYVEKDFSGTSITGWTCNEKSNDITLYAKNTATVTFVMNGHGTSIENQNVVHNNVATAPTAPTDSSYYFKGWYSDSSLSTRFDFTTAVTKNISLYARWIDKATYDTYYIWSYPTSTPSKLFDCGSGTVGDPYIIMSAQQLANLSYMVNNGNTYSGVYFKQGKEIDLNIDYAVNGENENCSQWKPIGKDNANSFQGIFDGDLQSIKGLYIDGPSCQYAGLFGYIRDGVIKNTILEQGYICNTYSAVNTKSSYTGALIGAADTSSSSLKIISCNNSVTVVATNKDSYSYAGGLIGYCSNSYSHEFCIINCCNKASVNIGTYVHSYGGGLVGYAFSYVTIENSWNCGTINSNNLGQFIGGAQYNNSYAICCYSLSNCGTSSYGSVVTKGCGQFTSADVEMSGLDGYNGTLLYVLSSWVNDHEDYVTWKKGSDGYPQLTKEASTVRTWYPTSVPTSAWSSGSGTESDPYLVSTAQELGNLAYLVNHGTTYSGCYFKLNADIDLNEGYTVKGTNTNYTQWKPIGMNSTNYFAGVFDGNFHTVTGVYIDSPEYKCAGLFGYINNGTIKNLFTGCGYIHNTYSSLADDYTDCSYTGGIAGNFNTSSSGMIQSCSNKISIVVTNAVSNSYAGGVVGYSIGNYNLYSSVCNSCNRAAISGATYIGGIAGYLYYYCAVSNCYNTGYLSGTKVGGVIGVSSHSTVQYCYYSSTCNAASVCEGATTATTSCGSFSSPTAAMSGLDGYNGTLLYVLNSWVCDNSGYESWRKGNDGYPEITSGVSTISSWYPTIVPTTAWNSGSGSVSDPYVITTALQLANLAYLVNNGNKYTGSYFQLGADIDLNEGITVSSFNESCKLWKPIGISRTDSFAGKFDGNGHVVKGLYVYDSNTYVGLFGYISGATLSNVVISSGYVCNTCDKDNYIGSIAGYIDTSTIKGCSNSATIFAESSSSSSAYYSYAGGLFGYAESDISSCANTGSVKGTGYYVCAGGIAGYATSNVSSSTNSGSVSATGTGSDYVAGIVGKYQSSSTVISACDNSGSISECGTDITAYLGGIVGYGYYGTVNLCSNTGNVTDANGSGKTYIGGINGYQSYFTIKNVMNTGALYGRGTTVYAGGLSGMCDNSSYIYNGKNSGTVKGLATTTGYVGGIAGYMGGIGIYNNFAKGTLDGSGTTVYIGGIAGNRNSGSIYYCYWYTTCGATYAIANGRSSSYETSIGSFSSSSSLLSASDSTTLLYTGNLINALSSWVTVNSSYTSWIAGGDGWPVLSTN